MLNIGIWIFIMAHCFCVDFISAGEKITKKVGRNTNDWKPVEMIPKKLKEHQDDYSNWDGHKQGYHGSGYYNQRDKEELVDSADMPNGFYDSDENFYLDVHPHFSQSYVFARATATSSNSATSNSNNNGNSNHPAAISSTSSLSGPNYNRPGSGYGGNNNQNNNNNNNNNNANDNNYPYAANLNQSPEHVATATYAVGYGPTTVTTNPATQQAGGYPAATGFDSNPYNYYGYGVETSVVPQVPHISSTGYEGYRPGSEDNYYQYGSNEFDSQDDPSQNAYGGGQAFLNYGPALSSYNPGYAGFARPSSTVGAFRPTLNQFNYRNVNRGRGGKKGVFRSGIPDCERLQSFSLVSYRMPVHNEPKNNPDGAFNLYFV